MVSPVDAVWKLPNCDSVKTGSLRRISVVT